MLFIPTHDIDFGFFSPSGSGNGRQSRDLFRLLPPDQSVFALSRRPASRLVYGSSALAFAHKNTQTNHCERRWRQEFDRNTEWKFGWLSCVFFHWQTTGAHAVIGRTRACSFKRMKVYLCACPFQRRFIVCQWQTHLLVVLSIVL